MSEKAENQTHPEVDLSHVIADSKTQLSEAPPVVKRGRGRPRKVRPDDSGGGPATDAAGAPARADAAPNTQPVASLVPILVPALKAVSTIPAARYKVKELALSDEEATPLAQAVDQLIAAYAPDLSQMSPKTAAWLGFGMVASSIFIQKAQVYYAHSEKTIEQPVAKSTGPREPDQPAEQSGFVRPPGGLTLAADDYFKRPR